MLFKSNAGSLGLDLDVSTWMTWTAMGLRAHCSIAPTLESSTTTVGTQRTLVSSAWVRPGRERWRGGGGEEGGGEEGGGRWGGGEGGDGDGGEGGLC